ncbi:polysaccharide deacetylase family protein [Cohnella sp. REN36]|uniref:polysaccharide deacetylase family protein n=1 Tax=Cohnella sp. REN36 TaxID=2887347 RepID=UPI001D13C6AD|nr:polysaccharide deacetylase family protein [Cohnella sp. REN36]MCC3374716.1 polysaccharide deacetylase family protein [Cohnella sp. REN36]
MGIRPKRAALDYRKKNRRKAVKTVLQLAILCIVGYVLFHALADVKRYAEPDRAAWRSDNGFVALSYFGVSRSGTPKLMAKRQLDEQLRTLKEQGYVTISQQDVLDYYKEGKKLPDKALFLAFEDGRNDSSLFAQPLLEKYNFKATFLSYADKMGDGQRKFVQPGEMKKMAKTGYWELGSNGYRLSYINVFDSEGRFLGMKNEDELRNKMNVDYYNHYLMDFIRDGDMIPTENRQEMEARIGADYAKMKQVYTDKLGYVPGVYMIMHANAMHQGMNRLVSDANDANIRQMFAMHFNREGNALNKKGDDLYDLTRVQPQAYWYTNHLLMKLREDTGREMSFVVGDKRRAEDWTVVRGAAQFIDDRIALTSEPSDEGLMVLKNSAGEQDIALTATLGGNVVGKQSLYVRYDRRQETYVRVTLANNRLIVEQKKAGQAAETLLSRELDEVKWKETDLTLNKATVYAREQTKTRDLTEEREYPINISDKRNIRVEVRGDRLRVSVDGAVLLDGAAIDGSIAAGEVALASAPHTQSKRDDIYDAVFDGVKVEAIGAEGNSEEVRYSNRFSGVRKWIVETGRTFDAVVDWMIETF